MQIIDTCCGIGPWMTRDPILPYTPEHILAIMDRCGINAALVYDRMSAKAVYPLHEGNTAICQVAAQNPRLLPAFTFGQDPYNESPTPAEYLEAMRAANCRAAWMWPLHESRTASWLYGDIYTLCERVQLPLLLSANVYTPDDIYQIGRTYPRLRMILSGMDYLADVWLYQLLRQLPELRICYGHYYIPSCGIERFVRHFGAQRLLFGSGLPENAPGGLLGYVLYADITEEEKALILGGNIEALMAEVQYV